MAIVSARGEAEPFDADGQPYGAFGKGTPALRGFRLTFPPSRQRELVLIQVLPGGDAIDLTPNAQNQPSTIPDGRLQVALQDANPTGEEFRYNVSHSVMQIPGARRYQIRDVGCAGECSRTLPNEIFGTGLPRLQDQNPVIALVGFKLFFIGNRQHEIDRIGVLFDGHELKLRLRDQSVNLADTFGYLVDFVVIPSVGFNVSTGVMRGTAAGIQTVPLPSPSHANFMITGWTFNFQAGDREILDIGVLRGADTLSVFYGDNGGGEVFDWRVSWAHIAPRVLAPLVVAPVGE